VERVRSIVSGVMKCPKCSIEMQPAVTVENRYRCWNSDCKVWWIEVLPVYYG
jgi:hypothetical protein